MDIAGALPYNSPFRNKVQATTVSTLFNSLEHPPKSYLGEKHQYRTADGSNHVSTRDQDFQAPNTRCGRFGIDLNLQNFMLPQFGKAGMPYAKTVRSAKKMHGVKPDPGVLFDCTFMRRIPFN